MATSDSKSETTLKEFQKKRGILRGRITNFRKYVNSFEGLKISTQQRAKIKFRLVDTLSLLDDFNHIQSQIEDIDFEAEIEVHLEAREGFKREYYSVLGLAEYLIMPDEGSKSPLDNNNNSAIKLATISIPSFDGRYEHWLEFRDTILSLVHNFKTIPEIQKFHYLKSSLKGNAKSVINPFFLNY